MPSALDSFTVSLLACATDAAPMTRVILRLRPNGPWTCQVHFFRLSTFGSLSRR
jgi:hypothetical protein